MVHLLLIMGVSIAVFWLVGRMWRRLAPKMKTAMKTSVRGRILPLLLSPFALPVLRRVLWLVFRLILRR